MRYLVACALLAVGCASGPEQTDGEEAITEAIVELETSRVSGRVAANERNAYELPLRHNPSRCPCPRFEVWAYGAWERVWIEGTPSQLAQLEEFARGGGDSTVIRGVLTEARRPSERNVAYRVFELR